MGNQGKEEVNCFQDHRDWDFKAVLKLFINLRLSTSKLLIKEKKKKIASHTLHRMGNYNIHHCPLFFRPVELEQLFPLPNVQQ